MKKYLIYSFVGLLLTGSLVNGQAVRKGQVPSVKQTSKASTSVTSTTKQAATKNPVVPISTDDAAYLANASLVKNVGMATMTSQMTRVNPIGSVNSLGALVGNMKIVNTNTPTIASNLIDKGPQKYGVTYLPNPVYDAWQQSLDDLIYMIFYQQVAVNVNSDDEMNQKIAQISDTILSDPTSFEASVLGYKPLKSFQGSAAGFEVHYLDPIDINKAFLNGSLDTFMQYDDDMKYNFMTKSGMKASLILIIGYMTVK